MKRKYAIFLLLIGLFTIPIQSREVYLGGESIGIQLQYEGVLISATYQVDTKDFSYNPSESDIQSGDTLKEIDGRKIDTLEQLNEILLEKKNQTVVCTLKRKDEIIYRHLKVIEDNGKIKTGLFVKDEIMGIGTLTYIDPTNSTYGSLGHEIIDQDTKQTIRFDQGLLYTSSVKDIQKAQISRVGEKQALIHFDDSIGNILKISRFGVFGNSYERLSDRLIETASQDEIALGKATMYTVLNGEKVEAIEVEITKKYKQSEADIKSFEFQITDLQALEKTGGIIQGMSGTPIVQNGKLIGAVTHVSAQNPSSGFGIYIEWMLKESD